MSDPLRPLWDFDDLDATEGRFRALRAEALTQLARVQGLRQDYDGGDRLLDEVDEDDSRVRIRVDLERGRLRRSSGDKDAALPLFERAFAAATDAGEDWLAGDAAHMAALEIDADADSRIVLGHIVEQAIATVIVLAQTLHARELSQRLRPQRAEAPLGRVEVVEVPEWSQRVAHRPEVEKC